MPTYEVVLNDGRKLHIDADTPPTEEEVVQYLYPNPNTREATTEQFAPKPDQSKLARAPNTVDFVKNIGKDAVGMGKSALTAAGQRSKGSIDDFIVPKGDNRMTPSRMVDFIKGRAKADTDPGEIYNHPAQFLSDAAVVADMAPSVGRGVKAGAKWAVEPGPVKAAARGAIENTPLIGRPVKGAIRGVKKYYAGVEGAKPTPMAEGFDQFMPNEGGPMAPGARGNSSDRIAYGPSEVSAGASPNAGGRLNPQSGAREMSIEEILTNQLQEEMGARGQPNRVSGQPETTITPGGPMRQSGTFDAESKVGQPGGYSSGRPAISRQDYGEIADRADLGNYHGAGDEPKPPIPPEFQADQPAPPEQTLQDAGAQESGLYPGEKPPMTVDDAARSGGESAFQDQLVNNMGEAAGMGISPDSFFTPADPEVVRGIHASMGKDIGTINRLVGQQMGPTAFHEAEPWHSGADPGSPDALAASKLHRDEAEMDAIYRQLLADPRK